jgi:hypothetical protein
MPLELHIENANLSESHYSSQLITGIENFPGMVNDDNVT